jgi:general secretion pathway protein G
MKINNKKSNTSRMRQARQRAFTLVELLLVLAILAILAGIVLPKVAGRTEQARITAAGQDISSFKTALSMYEVDNGFFPKGQNGLADLMVRPNGAPNWKGPYLDKDKLPQDPWGKPYQYKFPGTHNPSGYDIFSMGPNGRGGNESIGNWTTTPNGQ